MGVETGILFGLAASQEVVLGQERHLVVGQGVDDARHLGEVVAVERAEGFHVGDQMPDEPSPLLIRFLWRLVDGKGGARHEEDRQTVAATVFARLSWIGFAGFMAYLLSWVALLSRGGPA